jgi:hypothetical protein
MCKKPFVHPKIALMKKIKELRKELKFWKNEHQKTLRKLVKLKERNARIW